MKFSSLKFTLALLTLALSVPLYAQSEKQSRLDNVLAQLDAASAHFKSATADFSSDSYEAVVRDHTIQDGAIFFERSSGGTQMGSYVFAPNSKTKERVIAYKNGKLDIFEPRVNQVTHLHSASGQAESYLTLGFGGSGKDLSRAWDITDDGVETLSDSGHSVSVEKLELVSKDPGVRSNFSRVILWIDTARGASLKQVFETPSGDKRTATYSHIQLNTKIDTAAFEIKRDKHTTDVTH